MSETLVTLLVLYALYHLRILDGIVLIPFVALMLVVTGLGWFWDLFTGAGRFERAEDE